MGRYTEGLWELSWRVYMGRYTEGLWELSWRVYMGWDTEGYWELSCRLYLSFVSVVCICRLYLSFISVVYIRCQGGTGRKEEEGGRRADVTLKSNNPNLKGGEQTPSKHKTAQVQAGFELHYCLHLSWKPAKPHAVSRFFVIVLCL